MVCGAGVAVRPDEKGVEVFEHLPPEIVDGAVALVGDDEIEFLDRHGGVVGDVAGARAAEGGGELRAGKVVGALREFFAAQDRVEPLDGADGDAAHVVDVRRGEVLDVVKLGEKTARVRRAVAVELVAGLLAEVRAVHEEEDAAGAGVFDQAIGERAGGEGLARAGRHVDERARSVLGEGFFEAGDGFDLAIAHAIRRQRVQRRHLCETGAQRVRFGDPLGERLRAMKGEDTAGARVGIARVAEERFDAGGFVEETVASRMRSGGEEVGQAGGVTSGLIGDNGERGAFLLGLDHADGACGRRAAGNRTGRS